MIFFMLFDSLSNVKRRFIQSWKSDKGWVAFDIVLVVVCLLILFNL